MATATLPFLACFNPRPPSLTGEPPFFALLMVRSGFNPRPPSLTGEPGAEVLPLEAVDLFQSTPAIADGRTTPAGTNNEDFDSFNPRPPSLTGELRAHQAIARHAGVSIHARHR